ncbi:MAG: hypothetical protein J7501_03955 [Bdellovibrio sp.]|nr:hypothetical protein [Bdellovibrio sp.]
MKRFEMLKAVMTALFEPATKRPRYKAKRFGMPKPEFSIAERAKLATLSGRENKREKKAYVRELKNKYYSNV